MHDNPHETTRTLSVVTGMMMLSELDSVRLSLSSLIMMMLVTKDSEDDVDLDQEVAYHVCAASRARRVDVWRV